MDHTLCRSLTTLYTLAYTHTHIPTHIKGNLLLNALRIYPECNALVVVAGGDASQRAGEDPRICGIRRPVWLRRTLCLWVHWRSCRGWYRFISSLTLWHQLSHCGRIKIQLIFVVPVFWPFHGAHHRQPRHRLLWTHEPSSLHNRKVGFYQWFQNGAMCWDRFQ